MQPDAIKSFIHEQIDLIQDPTDLGDLLEIVTTFVDSRLTPMPDDTPAELDRLRKQLRDIEEGRMKFIPHEQVIRETEQFMGRSQERRQSMNVVEAYFLGDYRINVHFSDGTQRLIDFTTAFSHLQGYYAQYRQPELFQGFTIDNGNLVWGEDWDVIYPTRDLYEGKIG